MSEPSRHSAEPPPPDPAEAASVDPDEVARFAALAERWWDSHGAFRPLHALNPVRIGYLRDRLCAALGRDPKAPHPLTGLRLLDVGCGGGLIAEPMARLGAAVVGIDAAAENIAVAKLHAAQSELAIDYRHGAPEALAAGGERFDAVLALEVVEHVADLRGFLGACAALLEPGGAICLATLNRTAAAYLLGVVAAERVLRWLPAGTHQWDKFVRPAELVRLLRDEGVTMQDLSGVFYDPLRDRWVLGRNLQVNYLAFGVKRGRRGGKGGREAQAS